MTTATLNRIKRGAERLIDASELPDPPMTLLEDMRQVLSDVRRYASFGRVGHMHEVWRVLARYEREQAAIERAEQVAASHETVPAQIARWEDEAERDGPGGPQF